MPSNCNLQIEGTSSSGQQLVNSERIKPQESHVAAQPVGDSSRPSQGSCSVHPVNMSLRRDQGGNISQTLPQNQGPV